MAVTMQDIAMQARVTKNTVSVALRGKNGVSPATRKKIFQVAKSLGYTPNLAARALSSGKSGLVGLVIDGPMDYITQKKVSEIEKKLRDKGYQILLGMTHSTDDEQKYLETFRSRSVEVIIVCGKSKTLDHNLYRDCSCPVIVLDCKSDCPNVNTVRIDREYGIAQATNHLLDLGHRNIALVMLKPDRDSMYQRIAGIQNTFRKRGLTYDDSYIVYADSYTLDGFYRATYDLLKQKTPTAIIGQNDLFCMAIRSAVHKMGLRIPDDISLIGHDDFDFAPHFSPALTTIQQPISQIAAIVSSMIENHLENGNGDYCQEIILKGALIVRDSTASPGA